MGEMQIDEAWTERWKRWQTVAGVDFHILATLLLRGWSILAGGVTLLLLPLFLSAVQQGYYYTFASVLALQIFFELGLNQIVMQLVSHEVAHLEPTESGAWRGDLQHVGRLASLAGMLNRWYGLSAILFGCGAAIVGGVFFAERGTEPVATWLGAWLSVVAATACNLWLSPRLTMLEGCGQIGHVARLRLLQSVLGYLGFWTLLLTGAGLWSTAAVPVANALGTAYWVRRRGNFLDWLRGRQVLPQHQLRWRHDVLPLQWRMALSWASGYLIFNLFTPVVFARKGAIEAGRLGIALALFSAISTVGMSWVYAKAPNFTAHIARGEYQALNALFRRLLIRSTSFVAVGSLSLVALVSLLAYWRIGLAARLESPEVMLVLALNNSLSAFASGLAIYMRAHRKEPMTALSVVMAVVVSGIIYWSANASVFTMMLAYFFACLVSLPWTLHLFMSFYKKNAHV